MGLGHRNKFLSSSTNLSTLIMLCYVHFEEKGQFWINVIGRISKYINIY